MSEVIDLILECNLDYDLSYSSIYLRHLKGTTNAYVDIPTNIDVFINGVKTSPVDILNQDDKLTSFEKDLYLSDGKNVIKVVATDIDGNTKEITFEIIVDYATTYFEKEDLLTNFIGDDDSKISLHLGTSDLRYEDSSAGSSKDVIIDTSINSHYFSLEGENATLYRISKDKLPKIQGDIIKRPLSITFDYVEKIYDGNNDITDAMKRLKMDNGYYLTDVNRDYVDYSNSGFVRGTHEGKLVSDTIFEKSEIIFKEQEYIPRGYIINTPNIDYKNFYINIDGVEGYALLDEFLGNAQIILSNESLDKFFSSIELVKFGDKSILKFNYIENLETQYRVVNNVNIKYNYNDNKSSYITYKPSDEGLMEVDFSKAFFKSKDVTDEIQKITLKDIKFIGTTLGDVSNNYQIANYGSTGKILKRTITPHIECLNKIYDGSPIIPFKTSEEFYNGLENSISGDDIYIDNTFEGNKDDEFHYFTKTGSTVLVAIDENVGSNKEVHVGSIVLEGTDAKNYILEDISANIYTTSILKRPITVTINKLRLIRATRQWEIDYTILNDIKKDKLTIAHNTNDDFDIKVYGGIDKNGHSIHLNNSKQQDILSMYFNYPFNTNYQFVDNQTEVKLIDNKTAYWINGVRVAEPDTERIDITVESDKHYPGEIKQTLNTLSDGTQTSYFESENKEYKLYSGCKVMIKNINLNPINDKIKNYTLLNSTCETEIEII